ncbi:RNA polymerase sigma factor [Thalassotalea sp. 1_MG-2023]|uniref:RNA polymerase sigma factor n=1 Tax=Thalassotalea sp. 1_MG-2023 TaxID=3062680 RepID=UPI0026E42E9C|nr:RNA polymerase sigma factor [Thalassotalea sp. 1_MG-2023]MDO6427125.1 RNA polymerase sigma factor [Thalassotalea sp. 1_MG-2023]
MINVKQADLTIEQEITACYQRESGAVLATLMRLLNGHFDLAEEALQDAFTAALTQWPKDGVPKKPRAWLISTGRFKAIDKLRKNSSFSHYLNSTIPDDMVQTASFEDPETIEDDLLRLIFTCCHPALAIEARLALTLREVCGLTTEAIAAAFLIPVPTLAQRIVRAKNKICELQIPYEVPDKDQLPERLTSVLAALYLLFNEGYSATVGQDVTCTELSLEAIRLTRLLSELMPQKEIIGLLALMLLHDARKKARMDEHGELVSLEEQNRLLWDQPQIAEGCQLVKEALSLGPADIYTLQAAIAAVHGEAQHFEETNWAEITGLYQVLLSINFSPIYALNHAVALSMRDGPTAGLKAIEAIEGDKALQHYYLLYAAKADLYRQLAQKEKALSAYQRALGLTQQAPEKRFIEKRMAAL